MNILVCVKQVPDSEALFEIDGARKRIKYGVNVAYRMNRFDEYAVEEAIRIKESLENVIIDIISVGPERVDATIRRAIGMGGDNGIHILLNDEERLSPFECASLIASYACDKNYDLIFTGVMAEDDMQSQTGQLIAGILNMPFASSCMEEKLRPDEKIIYIERELEGGLRESVILNLPALLTIQSGINRPRYPSLSNTLRAKKLVIDKINANLLNKSVKNVQITDVYYPKNLTKGLFIKGSPEEKAEKLLKILHEESLI